MKQKKLTSDVKGTYDCGKRRLRTSNQWTTGKLTDRQKIMQGDVILDIAI
jgi:hypothetical protein